MNGIQWGPFRWGRLPESRAYLAGDRDKWMTKAAARLDVIDTVRAHNASLTLDVARLERELADRDEQIALQRRTVDRALAGRLQAEKVRNATAEHNRELRDACADLRQRLGRIDQPRDDMGRFTSATGKQFTTAAEVLTALRTPTDRGAEMPPAAGDHTTAPADPRPTSERTTA